MNRCKHFVLSIAIATVCSGAVFAVPAASAANVAGLIPTGNTDSFSGTLNWQGQARSYFVIRPRTSAAAAPALFLLHPRDTTAVQMANLSRAGRLAASDGAWVFMPSALNGQWHDDPSPTGEQAGYADDVGFLSALMDVAVAQYGIDSKRIYAAGYSNGGYMAQRLACERADRVAGVGSVAANLRRTTAAACRPSLALPVVLMPGTADPVVAYKGNLLLLPTADTTQLWVNNDRCIGAPVVSQYPQLSGDPTRVSLSRYANCTSGSEVSVYTIDNGGHTWPGTSFPIPALGNTSQTIDATIELWKVLSAYRLR